MKKYHDQLYKKFDWYKRIHEFPNRNLFFWIILLVVSVYATCIVSISGNYLVASTGNFDDFEEPASNIFFQREKNDLEDKTVKLIEKQEKDKTVKRYKISEGRTDYINRHSPRYSQSIKIDLFDGLSVTLDKVKYIDRGKDDFTWIGKIKGVPDGQAILTVADGHMSGFINITEPETNRKSTYSVESMGENLYSIRENDFSAIEDEPNLDDVKIGADKVSAAASSVVSTPSTQSTLLEGETVVDVMVLYTNQSAASAGSAMTSQAQLAIDSTNLAYANSGLPIRLNLVHVEAIPYTENGDFYKMLADVAYHMNGAENVGVLREAYQADMVSMIVDSSAYCGLGYVNSISNYAYSVVQRSCATSNLSFAHELGHNFGLLHDPVTDPSTYPYAYGHGYVDTGCQFRTVMAYPSCGTPRVPYFSNPNAVYPGTNSPMGTADLSDAVRVLSERASAVANFFVATTTYCLRSSPAITVTPSSQAGSAGQSLSYSVNLINNDNATCPSSNFSVTSNLPAGFTQTPAQLNFTLTPGAQDNQSFVMTSGTSVVPANYTFAEVANNTTVSGYQSQANVVYTVNNIDVTPPSVSISSPLPGATLSKRTASKVTINSSASDANGISLIKISVDGSLKKSCTMVNTCSYSWTYSNVTNGQHIISVVANDNSSSKNSATATTTVSVTK